MVSEPEKKKPRVSRDRDPGNIVSDLKPILSDTLHLFKSLTKEDYKVWYKAEDDPVTEVDLQLDRYLKHRLLDRWPGYGWLSEETLDDRRRLGKRRTWIVDPLDGTRQFVAGLPEYATSIALEEDGRIIAAAVLMLASGDCYTAARGSGAYLNGCRLQLRGESQIGRDRIVVSRREAEAGRFDPWGDELVLRPVGGMACKLARVADGYALGTFTREMRHEWDVAGGALLVEEAGGRMSDGSGAPLTFNTSYARHAGVVASDTVNHDALLALCRRSSGDTVD